MRCFWIAFNVGMAIAMLHAAEDSSSSDGDAALLVLDEMDREQLPQPAAQDRERLPEPAAQMPRGSRGDLARKVLACVRRREATAAEAAQENKDHAAKDMLSFGLYEDTATFSVDTVNSLVFGKRPQESISRQAQEHNMTGRMATRVRGSILLRWAFHVAHAFEQAILVPALLVTSFKYKWDETEQLVSGISQDVQEVMADMRTAGLHMDSSCKKTTHKRHVVTFGIWAKTSNFPEAQPWFTHSRQLRRTTAECIWTAFSEAIPHGPWGTLPSTMYVWLICCADEATSNLRFFSQGVQWARTKHSRALGYYSPCFIHICQRSVIPLMQESDAIKNLFRAAHVLSVGSYWENLLRMVRSLIGKIVILHNWVEQAVEHLAVAKDIEL